ncbi:hypothetical protein P7C73_g3132, partial [Tremellales sp. Uapishka_1]
MSNPNPNMASRASRVNASYHPNGYGTSPSLIRARKPFLLRNALTGVTIFGFAMGVYIYSISAVKQDDFADVVDLLPPIEERGTIKSIEDEVKEKAGDKLRAVQAIASVLPKKASNTVSAAQELPGQAKAYIEDKIENVEKKAESWSWKPLNETAWVKKWIGTDERGNVLVWGAPNVDRIGKIGDAGNGMGRRLV